MHNFGVGQTLRGSVVEHQDLRSDSHGDMEMEKNFFLYLAGSKSNHLSYSICYPVDIFQISQRFMHKMLYGEETQLPFIRGGRF